MLCLEVPLLLFAVLGDREGEADLRRSVALLWLWGGSANTSGVSRSGG